MTAFRGLRGLAAALFRRNRLSQDMAAEWQFHIEEHAASLERQGLPRDDAARRAALAFGSAPRWRERTWDVFGIRWLDDLRRDLHLACRMLWKDRAFSVTITLTLAICFGAYAAAYTVVDQAVLRPLRIPQSERLVTVNNNYPLAGTVHVGATAPDYFDRLRDLTAFEQQTLIRTRRVSATFNGAAERVDAMQVMPSFFDVVRTMPRMGRAFVPGDEEVGGPKIVIVSDAVRRLQLGAGDPLGKVVRIEGEPYTIVGVMPREFSFLEPRTQVWLPLVLTDREKAQRYSNSFLYIARLKPDATVAQVQAQVDALNAVNLQRYPETKPVVASSGFHSVAARLDDDLVRDVRSSLYLLWAGAVCVLLIGLTNVGNLVVARAWARQKEIGTRLALGAGAGRLLRQFMTQQLMLTLVSASVALPLAAAILRVLGAAGVSEIARWADIRIDGRVIAVVLITATAAGVALGLMPSLAGCLNTRLVLADSGGRAATSGRRFRALRRTLVAAQVAIAFVLALGALLLFANFRSVMAIHPGFDPTRVLTASISLPASRYDTFAAVRFTRDTLDQLRASPGVRAVGATTALPFARSVTQDVMLPEGFRMAPGAAITAAYHSVVTPGYMEAMGVALRRGRLFDDRDTAEATRVVIVDERLARHYWGDRDPVGLRMFAPSDPQDITAVTPTTRWFTVAGVVADVRQRGMLEDEIGAFYTVYTQLPRRDLSFAVRAHNDTVVLSATVRRVVAGLDPEVAVFDVRSMASRTEEALSGRQLSARLSMIFSVVALALCGIGVYGVLAYLVAQRHRELAIRLALGSTPGDVARLVFREGLVLCGVGAALGSVASIAFGSALRRDLFGPVDQRSAYLAVIAAVALVAVIACMVPARRAGRIDATTALGGS